CGSPRGWQGHASTPSPPRPLGIADAGARSARTAPSGALIHSRKHMFTGIVTAIGRITEVTPLVGQGEEGGVRLAIHAPGFLRADSKLGDSIAIQGACMTVVALQDDGFQVDVSRESLNRTVGLDQPGEVNLEHAMRLGDTLDGHIVSGHVDGTAVVSAFEPVGESWALRIVVPQELARYMAYKGSVTVNG